MAPVLIRITKILHCNIMVSMVCKIILIVITRNQILMLTFQKNLVKYFRVQ